MHVRTEADVESCELGEEEEHALDFRVDEVDADEFSSVYALAVLEKRRPQKLEFGVYGSSCLRNDHSSSFVAEAASQNPDAEGQESRRREKRGRPSHKP